MTLYVQYAKHALMLKQEAIEHFGSQANLARALGVSRSAISQWPDEVPEGRDYQIEILTKGKLKANRPRPAQTVAA